VARGFGTCIGHHDRYLLSTGMPQFLQMLPSSILVCGNAKGLSYTESRQALDTNGIGPTDQGS
jgi:hypothetical protein